MIRVFTGANTLARQEAFHREVENWLGEKIKDPYAREVFFMDDKSTEIPPVERFFTSLDSPSFFADRKALCLRNFDTVKGADLEALIKRLLKPKDEETGVFIDASTLDQRNKWIKELAKAFPPQKFENPKPWELPKWIEGRCQYHGFKINSSTAQFLSEFFLQDCDVINSELEKLRLQFPDLREINEEVILNNFQGSNEGNLFEWLNAFGKVEKKKFFAELQKLTNAGVEKIALVANLYSHTAKLIQVKWLQQDGCSEKDICSQMNINSYLYKKNNYAIQASKRTFPRLERVLVRIVEIDEGLKSGSFQSPADFDMALLALLY